MISYSFNVGKRLKYASYLFIFLLFISSCSKEYSEYLTSRYQQGGNLYFISELKGWSSSDIEASLKYDLTYLAAGDTVTINISCFSEKQIPFSELKFKKDTLVLLAPTDMFFLKMEGNQYHHRISAKVSFRSFEKLVTISETHPKLQLRSNTDTLNFSINQNKWKQQRNIMINNFRTIKMNSRQ